MKFKIGDKIVFDLDNEINLFVPETYLPKDIFTVESYSISPTEKILINVADSSGEKASYYEDRFKLATAEINEQKLRQKLGIS